MPCPTCLAIRAVLEAAGMPYEDAAKVGDRVGKPLQRKAVKKVKRKASAYAKRYGRAFKRLAPRNKKKNGGWKAGGFLRTQKAAHREAKR